VSYVQRTCPADAGLAYGAADPAHEGVQPGWQWQLFERQRLKYICLATMFQRMLECCGTGAGIEITPGSAHRSANARLGCSPG
jgi:hypothetical protein